jgi:hypothetical protein
LDPEYNVAVAYVIFIENCSVPEAELWDILCFFACGGRESDSWLSSLEVLEGAKDSESLISVTV